MKRDPSPVEPSPSLDSSSGASTTASAARNKSSRQSSDTAWNWVLILALVGTVYYFWIFPIQFPRKPLKVIFESGAQSQATAAPVAKPTRDSTTPTGQNEPSANELPLSEKTTEAQNASEPQTTTEAARTSEPANESKPTR